MSFADRMERAAERADADAAMRDAEVHNAAMAARCPIASMLMAELADLIRYEYSIQRFGDKWSLLASAEMVCHEAILAGRDLRHDGQGDAVDVSQVARFAREDS